MVRHGESRVAGKSSEVCLQSNVTSCDGDNLYYRGVISTSKMGGGAFLFSFLSLPFLVVLGTEQRPSCMLCRAHALLLDCTPVSGGVISGQSDTVGFIWSQPESSGHTGRANESQVWHHQSCFFPQSGAEVASEKVRPVNLSPGRSLCHLPVLMYAGSLGLTGQTVWRK